MEIIWQPEEVEMEVLQLKEMGKGDLVIMDLELNLKMECYSLLLLLRTYRTIRGNDLKAIKFVLILILASMVLFNILSNLIRILILRIHVINSSNSKLLTRMEVLLSILLLLWIHHLLHHLLRATLLRGWEWEDLELDLGILTDLLNVNMKLRETIRMRTE